MAEGDRAALGVDDVRVHLPGVHARQRLHGERLVQLDGGDVGPCDPRALQRPVRRLHGGVSEQLRVERGHSPSGDTGDRVGADPCGGGTRAEQDGRGAVTQRGGVAGRDDTVGAEDGLEPGELLGRGAGADALVPVEGGALGVHGDGHDQLVVETRVPGVVGEVVGAGGEGVLALAGDGEAVGELFVRLAQGDGPLLGHALVDQSPAERGGHGRHVTGGERPRGLGQDPGGPGHRLDPAGEHDVRVAGLDGAGGDDGGVQGGPAQTVDGRGRHRGRQSRQEYGHPADVPVVLTGAVGVAPDDVADLASGRARVSWPGSR